MTWPFTRKPRAIDPGPINEDWRPGDLAECLASGWDGPEGIGPEYGDVLVVRRVKATRGTYTSKDAWFLGFSGQPRDNFEASAFRKLPPYHSAADAEFAARIKGLRPARVGAESARGDLWPSRA